MLRTLMLLIVLAPSIVSAQADLSAQSLQAMKQAADFFHQKVTVNGGYVYEYSLDLKQRQGEGKAAPTEIWVQPPGNPTVGMAYVSAFDATGDQQFLSAAIDAAQALIFGQLESGGWNASIDFDPQGPHADRYRNGKGRAKGKNFSSLDDDKTQSAVYEFKAKPRIDRIEQRYQELKQTGEFRKSVSNLKTLTRDAERIVSELDSEGRWLSNEKGEPVTAATHLKGESQVISSELFSRNMQRLSEYLTAVSTGK